MVASAVSGSGAVSGFVSEQLRVQLAQRNADQAEAAARALRRQAADAQLEAEVAQEGARTLKVRSNQADGEAGQARLAVSSLESVGKLQSGLTAVRTQVADTLKAIDAPAPTPAVNAEGQTTGTLVNVTA